MSLAQEHSHCLVRIPEDVEIHLREADLLSRFARRFPCEVHLSCGERYADAKDALEILHLEPEPGGELAVDADGPDGERAVSCLAELVSRRFPSPTEALSILGLLSLGAEAPEGAHALAHLDPVDALGAFGLLGMGRAGPYSLERLSPREALGAFGLLPP